jgi:agmatinase
MKLSIIYWEQLLKPFADCGIATIKPPKAPASQEDAINLLAGLVSRISADKKFPLILGGEHSLSQGSIKGLCAQYKDFSILHFDAHSDTRVNYYLGGQYSHGAVMSQILSKYPVSKLVQVGIRSLSDKDGEWEFRKKYQSIWSPKN